MANTYTLINSYTVTAGGGDASITFSSIPSTYTDLQLVYSIRSTVAYTDLKVTINGSTSSYSWRNLYGSGSGTGSSNGTNLIAGVVNNSAYTANTFASGSIYLPNYAGSTYKSYSGDATSENNATNAYAILYANLWSNTAAITSISLSDNNAGNLAQYSTAYLYGVKNA